MSSTKKLSEEIARGLRQALPELRQTLHNKLPLAIAAMLEAQTANTIELANHCPTLGGLKPSPLGDSFSMKRAGC